MEVNTISCARECYEAIRPEPAYGHCADTSIHLACNQSCSNILSPNQVRAYSHTVDELPFVEGPRQRAIGMARLFLSFMCNLPPSMIPRQSPYVERQETPNCSPRIGEREMLSKEGAFILGLSALALVARAVANRMASVVLLVPQEDLEADSL